MLFRSHKLLPCPPSPRSPSANQATSVNFLSEVTLFSVPLVPPLAPFLARDPTVKPAPITPATYPSLALLPTLPIPSTLMPLASPATSSNSSPDSFYVGETKNNVTTRMDGHWSSSNNPENLPLPVAIHMKSHQLPFNSCRNVCVIHNLPPNTNHITHRHLELPYQFVLFSRHSPGINLR